jgi:hypothetical protein
VRSGENLLTALEVHPDLWIVEAGHRHGSALKTAETTAGTIPSSMNDGMKHIISGNTLRTPTARARTWSPLRLASRAAAA